MSLSLAATKVNSTQVAPATPGPLRSDPNTVQQALEELSLAADLAAIGSERADLHRQQAYGFAWLAAQRPAQRLPQAFRAIDLLRTGFVQGLIDRTSRRSAA